MIVLIKLLLGHFIGDFLLQPDAWIKEKALKKHKSLKLYLHALLHGLLTFVLVWDFSFWLPAIAIVVTHFFIDLAKARFQTPDQKAFWFLLDQVLHLIVIYFVWYAWQGTGISVDVLNSAKLLVVLTAIVFLTNPSSVIIKTLISQWTPDTIYTVASSLPDAGKFIGFLERLLVLTFILHNHWEAVGFLLAAKSVFRFGNLKESHDRKLTEYVLIGTLLSFGIAIAVALIVTALLPLANGPFINGSDF
jgi:hypothetical protein